MSIKRLFSVLGIVVMVAGARVASAEDGAPGQGRVVRPLVAGVELGGRGRIYSVQAEYAMSRWLSAGLGAMALPVLNPDAEHNESGAIQMAMASLTLHFLDTEASPFVTGVGAACYGCRQNCCSGQPDASWSFVPEAGAGIELRSENGFVGRLTAYRAWVPGRFGGRETRTWVGIFLGGAGRR